MPSKFPFSLGSYNLLAPALAEANSYLYYDVHPGYLQWDYRRHRLLNEISFHNADIYCFQEMQQDQYYEFFYPKLKQLGYYCLFKKRTGDKPDGCCIIFKRKKFQLVSFEFIEYFQDDVESLSKDNIGIICLLQPKQSSLQNERICVATTHIFFSPKRGDVKLAQIQMLLASIDRIAFKALKKTKDGLKHLYHPIILCGDMNSVYRSPFYQFLTESKLANYTQFNRSEISGQYKRCNASFLKAPLIPENVGITDQTHFVIEIEKRNSAIAEPKIEYSFGKEDLQHPFQFQSVYEYFDRNGDQFVTTCLPQSHEFVDYIFYHNNNHKSTSRKERMIPKSNTDQQEVTFENQESSDDENECQIEIVSTLELFTKKQVEYILMPNKHYASDHFLLAANFLLTLR